MTNSTSKIIASADQMTAITWGSNSKDSWERIPEDEWMKWDKPIPLTISDAHIDWMEGFGNSPDYKLRLKEAPLDGLSGEAVWEEIEPGCFVGLRPEGWGTCHYHRGGLAEREYKDGTKFIGTPQQEGYAGRHFKITLSPNHPKYPNQEVVLRGPWHGCPPNDYVEVSYYIPSECSDAFYKERPWYNRGGYFGLLMPRLMFLAVMAKFRPEIRFADIHRSYGDFVTPLRPETNHPKGYYCLPDMCDGHIFRTQYNGPAKQWDRCFKCNIMRKDTE